MLEEEYEKCSGDDDQFIDDWGTDQHDAYDCDDQPMVSCPYCRREIYEESLRCPYCEQYISSEDSPRETKPWWIVVGAVAALYAALRWIF